VGNIKSAYKQSDYAEVKKLAYRIQSALSYYAVVKMEKDMRQIEELAGEGIATIELELKIKNWKR